MQARPVRTRRNCTNPALVPAAVPICRLGEGRTVKIPNNDPGTSGSGADRGQRRFQVRCRLRSRAAISPPKWERVYPTNRVAGTPLFLGRWTVSELLDFGAAGWAEGGRERAHRPGRDGLRPSRVRSVGLMGTSGRRRGPAVGALLLPVPPLRRSTAHPPEASSPTLAPRRSQLLRSSLPIATAGCTSHSDRCGTALRS